MKAESNGTAPEAGVRYIECDWGDLIEGSKEQLQALGLGIGLAYPGEVGGPRLDLKVRDPRGYLVRISNSWHHDGRFTAYLGFPHWPERPKAAFLATVVRGVKKREFIWADEYVGCAAALAAAGLVRVDQLPGMPGMGKVSVTIYPDGTTPPGGQKARYRSRWEVGTRVVRRISKSMFEVQVTVAKAEGERRCDQLRIVECEWLRKVRSLPRPARLQPMAEDKWRSLESAQATAARDVRFQGMLARVVGAAGRPSV